MRRRGTFTPLRCVALLRARHRVYSVNAPSSFNIFLYLLLRHNYDSTYKMQITNIIMGRTGPTLK